MGIPCAVICSDEFGPLARAEAQVLGMDCLPLIAIPHPLAGNHRELVGAKARAVVGELTAALTDPPELLATRYRSQFVSLTERRLTGGALCIDDVCAVDPGLTR